MSFFSSIRGLRPKKAKNGQARFDSNPTSPIMPNGAESVSSLSKDTPMILDQPSQQAPSQQTQQQQQQLQQLQQLQQQQQQQLQQQTQQSQSSQQQQTPQAVAQDSEPPLFLCQPFVRTTLVKGSFKTIVQLPKYVDYNEWLALNVFEILTNLNQFFSLVKDFIPPDSPMIAGPGINYSYYDSQSNKSYNLPAAQFIEYTLTNLNDKINDQASFPTKNGNPFPPNFLRDIKSMCSQMFKIFAYIYHNQFDKIIHLSLEPHWNSFFAHFISFVKEFNLLDDQELLPMSPLIISFEQQGHIVIGDSGNKQ